MKSKILLLLTITISTITMAQVKPSFGVRAGMSVAGMRGDAVTSLENMLDFAEDYITTSDRKGFFAGGYVNVPVGNIISLEPALHYSQKGYELRGELNVKGMEFLGANAKAKLNTHYIDLPLMVKANIKGLQLFAGPQVSYLAQADLRTTAAVLGFNVFNKTMDASEQFNRWDAAITGGVGYQFTNGLNVMAAYDHGLSKVDANKDMNSYNRAFKVGIGMSF
ncbi:MAG: hypothetical protein JWQ96_376 [Segetibacter sp.]|nr:hypothetical protein [Segetibacter sp.]